MSRHTERPAATSRPVTAEHPVHSVQCTADMANAWFSVGRAAGLPKRTGDNQHQ